MMALATNGVRERAIEIAFGQASIPKSPATRDTQGRVMLCLAAIVAKAGFLARGRQSDASELERDLADGGAPERLERAFADLGWDIGECRAKMEYNDRMEEGDRKLAVLKYLTTANESTLCLRGDAISHMDVSE